jgi:hypothetical protein
LRSKLKFNVTPGAARVLRVVAAIDSSEIINRDGIGNQNRGRHDDIRITSITG